MAAPSSDSAGIRQAIRALRGAGYTLVEVWDGEETVPVKNESEAVAAITAVDDATLFVRTPEGDRDPWVRFVMGNDPEEVICDYVVDLTVLDDLIDTWIAEEEGA